MKITEIKEASPFKDLFEIKEETFEGIQDHMIEHGYDPSQPIGIWKGKDIIIDGHTRFRAAKDLYDRNILPSKFADIPVVELSFDTQEEGVEYAIHNQTERRNLSDWDILKLVERVDELYPQGGDRKSEKARAKSNFGNAKIDSRKRTAKIVGISPDKVSQCRFVWNNCDQKTLESIRNGEKTLYRIYRTARGIDVQKEADKLQKKEGEKREIVKGYKISDFATRKALKTNQTAIDDLFLKHLQALRRCAPTMREIKFTVEHLKSSGMNELLFKQPGFKKFLRSQFVSNFLYILETFGFEIKQPKDLAMECVSTLLGRDSAKRNTPFLGFPELQEFLWKRPDYYISKNQGESFHNMLKRFGRYEKEGRYEKPEEKEEPKMDTVANA